jgi:precorrin isomerase
LGSPVSSTNKTDHHDKDEILLKMALSTINPYISNHLLFRNYIVDRTGKALKGFMNIKLDNKKIATNGGTNSSR